MKNTNLPPLIRPSVAISAAALLLVGCSKNEEPPAPAKATPKASDSASATVQKSGAEVKETVQPTAQDAAPRAGAEADKLKAPAQEQVQAVKDRVATEADKLKAQGQEQAQSARDLASSGADKVKAQAQGLIDQASKLVAEAKYAEAADVLKKLANSKLDSEQQKSVDALGVQIKKALAADAAKSVGDLLKGNK